MANVSAGTAVNRIPVHRPRLVHGEPPDTNKVLMTKVGLKFTAALSFEDWERAGHRLSSMVDSSSWCLGDWLVYGMDNYTDRYRHAIRTVGLQYQTLRNYFWVARQFPLERRRARLSFQHHAEVAALPPDQQDRLLDRAEHLAWTTKQLRSHVRDERADSKDDREPAAVLPRISVPSSRLARWRMAAEQRQTKFDNWLIEVLDSAAEQAISATGAQLPTPDDLPLSD